MFVRFRQGRQRLQVSLIETRRVGGKVRQERVASFGAVGVPPSVGDRVAFWHALHQKLPNLSNWLDAAAREKILGAVHARIPMVPPDELRSLQQENFEADERFWDQLRGWHESTIADHKDLLTVAEHSIALAEAQAKEAAAKVEAVKGRLARLKAGEGVAGGLASPGHGELRRIF
jgi:hypothetical protein